ncbi:uncharacterized protein LOC129717238 [Wyeomyia smithii]|uniref:uncharacterized protein LOC129717238 n=1 Tax=Wyeomyia smithii TaxID=174621 RepID=UPI00246816C4|nr:uncharacterized protein LOC129717238 [Wyeomyia smithii]
MDAILYYKNGWVQNISGRKIQDKHIVHGVVRHSFALNENSLRPWILIDEHGKILAAHCNCAIGILEACSHIGATLFGLEGIRTSLLEKKLSVTDLPAYWRKTPANISENLYKKVREIDFGKRIHKTYPSSTYQHRCRELLILLQEDGLNVAASNLYCGEINMDYSCATCTNDSRIKEQLSAYNLQSLHDPSNTYSTAELIEVASEYVQSIPNNPEMIKKINELTTERSDSMWWNVFRSGRVTASNIKDGFGYHDEFLMPLPDIKDVCSTQIARPSVSLIKRICYPNETTFSTSATKYGKKNEEKAIDQLYRAVKHLHQNLRKSKSGLIIYDKYPLMGASPDAIFSCDCHGSITVEVKCPFTARFCSDMTTTLLQLKDSFVSRNDSGEIVLNTKHKYFFQAMMQLYVCKANFGYFYVWSPNQVLLFEIKKRDEFWLNCENMVLVHEIRVNFDPMLRTDVLKYARN